VTVMRALRVILFGLLFAVPLAAYAEVPPGGRLTDQKLVDQDGKAFTLSRLYGKPLVLSFIYTSCTHTCGTLAASLKKAFELPGPGLGSGFRSLTVGFDVEKDTPEALHEFGSNFTDDFGAWRFASAQKAALERLMREAGFSYRKTEGGFDHPNMAVVIGPDGRVFQRLYGTEIEGPELMDSIARSQNLESPAYGQPPSGLVGFLKSLCYTYDEKTGAYVPDYGFLAIVALGFLVQAMLASIAVYVYYSARKRG